MTITRERQPHHPERQAGGGARPCAGGRPIYGRVCEFQHNEEISNKDVTKYVLAGNFSAIIVK